jgi:hypothetical protein
VGRQAKHSELEVIQAGLKIEAQGGIVSAFSIRNELGSGKPERFEKIWQKHQESEDEFDSNKTARSDVKLPAELQNKLDKLLEQSNQKLQEIAIDSWQLARNIAEARLTETVAKHEDGLLQLKQTKIEANRAIDNADVKIEELESDLKKEKLISQNLLQENGKLQGQLALMPEILAQQNETVAELNALKIAYAVQQGEVKHMRETSIFYPNSSKFGK